MSAIIRSGFTVAFVLLAFTFTASWGPKAGAAEPPDAKVKELLKERLAVLKEIATRAEKAFASGEGPFEPVLQSNQALLEAELELAEPGKERVAVLEKMVALAKNQEDISAGLVKLGAVPSITALKAKANRLQVEIALERARGK